MGEAVERGYDFLPQHDEEMASLWEAQWELFSGVQHALAAQKTVVQRTRRHHRVFTLAAVLTVTNQCCSCMVVFSDSSTASTAFARSTHVTAPRQQGHNPHQCRAIVACLWSWLQLVPTLQEFQEHVGSHLPLKPLRGGRAQRNGIRRGASLALARGERKGKDLAKGVSEHRPGKERAEPVMLLGLVLVKRELADVAAWAVHSATFPAGCADSWQVSKSTESSMQVRFLEPRTFNGKKSPASNCSSARVRVERVRKLKEAQALAPEAELNVGAVPRQSGAGRRAASRTAPQDVSAVFAELMRITVADRLRAARDELARAGAEAFVVRAPLDSRRRLGSGRGRGFGRRAVVDVYGDHGGRRRGRGRSAPGTAAESGKLSRSRKCSFGDGGK